MNSFLNFIIGIFFILIGIIGIMISLDAGTRTLAIQFILENNISIALFGFAFVVLGFAVVINLFLSFKRRYYKVRCENHALLVDETVIQDYVSSYWKKSYPAFDIPNRLTVKKNKIHIFADLPYMPRSEQKKSLEKIQEDLSDLFNRVLGYHDHFYLSISFQKEKSKPVVQ